MALRSFPPELPEEFLAYNARNQPWLLALPDLIARLADQWSLTIAQPYPAIRINYVAPAIRVDGTPCVFKVSQFVDEAPCEMAALRLWDGAGAARLLESDETAGAHLIELVEPGTMLLELPEFDDDAATLITVGVAQQLWRLAPPSSGLRPLADWCVAYDRNRIALAAGQDGFPTDVFRRADAMRAELLATTDIQTVLHGDLHHYNILKATRAPWLAIDPKGLMGDRCFDVCQFFRNPFSSYPLPLAVNRRRLDIFCSELGLDRQRTRDWAFVHAILDACWEYESNGNWRPSVDWAVLLLGL